MRAATLSYCLVSFLKYSRFVLLFCMVASPAMRAGEGQIAELIKHLNTTDADVRNVAIKRLSELGPDAADAAPRLVELLRQKDNYDFYSSRVCTVLEGIGAPALPAIMPLLNEADKLNHDRAIRIISKMGAAAVPALTGALNSKSLQARLSALEALESVGPAAAGAVDTIIAALGQSPEIDSAAISALGHIGPAAKKAIPALSNLMTDPQHCSGTLFALGRIGAVDALAAGLNNPKIRSSEMHANWWMGDSQRSTQFGWASASCMHAFCAMPGDTPGAVEAVLAAMKQYPETRSDGVSVLAHWGPAASKAIPALLALAREEKAIRDNCAGALAAMGEEALPSFKSLIGDANPAIRACAAFYMPGVPQAVPILAAALRDADPNVRRNAMETLYHPISHTKEFSRDSVLPAIAERLDDSDALTRRYAIWALKVMKEAALPTLPKLIQVGTDADADTRCEAFKAAIAVGRNSPQIVAMLKDALQDPSEAVRAEARTCLQRVGMAIPIAEGALTDLHRKLHDPDDQVRKKAVDILGAEAKTQPALIADLIPAIKDENVHVRAAAVDACHGLKEAARPALPTLLEALNDEDSNVVAGAGNAIVGMLGATRHPFWGFNGYEPAIRRKVGLCAQHVILKEKDCGPELAAWIDDENDALRTCAAWALLRIGSAGLAEADRIVQRGDVRACFALVKALQYDRELATEALPLLAGMLKHKNPALREAAASGLSFASYVVGIIPAKVVPQVAESLADPSPRIRISMLAMLRNSGAGKEVLPKLIPLLKDENATIRQQAALNAARIGKDDRETILPMIVALTQDKAASVRAGALAALGMFGPEAAGTTLPLLIQGTQDKSPTVRAGALGGIRALGPAAAAALPELQRLLKSNDRGTRFYAISATGSLGTAAKGAIPQLSEMLQSEQDNALKKLILDALGNIRAGTPAGAKTDEF